MQKLYSVNHTHMVKSHYKLTCAKLGKILGVPESTISSWCRLSWTETYNKEAYNKIEFLYDHQFLPKKLALFLVRFF